MLAVECLSAMPELACAIALMHCNDAPSVQLVLKEFSKIECSNSKFGTVSIHYECTDSSDGTVSSTGASVFLHLIVIAADRCTDAYGQLNWCY
jgi:hypothetical protein